MKLTRQQREALKRVFDRGPIHSANEIDLLDPSTHDVHQLSYREFRRTVQPAIGMDCIMVPWCGMWLGIETDGHTHS